MSPLVDSTHVTLFGRIQGGTTTVLPSDVATVRSTTTRGRCGSNCPSTECASLTAGVSSSRSRDERQRRMAARHTMWLIPRSSLARSRLAASHRWTCVKLQDTGKQAMTCGYSPARATLSHETLSAAIPGGGLVVGDEYHEGSCAMRAVLSADSA